MVAGATGVVMLFVVVDTLSKASADPLTVPPAMADIGPHVPLDAFETVSVAERTPTAEGVLVTVNVQSTLLSA